MLSIIAIYPRVLLQLLIMQYNEITKDKELN